MLRHFLVLFRFFLFWLIFFFLDRLVFILYFTDKLKPARIEEIAFTFFKGLRLDASTAMYVSAFPLIIYIILWLTSVRISSWIPKAYTYFLIGLFALISIVNFNIYREWGNKINYRVLDIAFSSPQEAMASSASSPLITSLLIFLVELFLGLWIAKQMIIFQMPKQPIPILQKVPAVLVLVVLAALLIRGGWQLSPINQSMAYFSEKPFLNHAAINTEWNLLHDVINNRSGETNPYAYLPESEVENKLKSIYPPLEQKPVRILSTTRPNVVVIILESFTGQLVESLGGEKGVSPGLERLIQDGVFFDNIYASGDRTDRGVVAVLSAFPSQAIRSIMKQNDKQEKLPAIAQSLGERGYSTSFYYGGESEFFNMKSYLLSHGFTTLVDKRTFHAKDMNSKWGAYDHVVFQKFLSDRKISEAPFFSSILSLTNHEPFELPGRHKFGTQTVEDKFRSTAYYTDSVLSSFLHQAKQQPWYKNTLFIVVADHGHRLPTNKFESFHPDRNKIPLLFFGDVIKREFRGKKISKLGSQTDIATTLLNQMQLPTTPFHWGKDLLNPSSTDFAFFDWDNGFGVVTPRQSISFDNVGKRIIYKEKEAGIDDDSLLALGKAYMQRVYQVYLKY